MERFQQLMSSSSSLVNSLKKKFFLPNKKGTELPKELWALVLGELEDVFDFGRVQLVSETFHALVQANCWTKVQKIDIYGLVEERVQLAIHTTVPWQTLLLPIGQAALLLEKLIQKATETAAVSVDFHWMTDERNDQVLCRFFDELAASNVKIRDLKLSRYMEFQPRTTPLALARFLHANKQSLTSLTVVDSFNKEETTPAELHQAFRDCGSLENVEIERCEFLVGSILHWKTHLKTLTMFDGPITPLFESDIMLRNFICTDNILIGYIRELNQRNRSQDHPLRSLEKLEVRRLETICLRSFQWALFPDLKQISICRWVYISDFVELVGSFLTHWSDAGVEKALEWKIDFMRTETGRRVNSDHLFLAAGELEGVFGCHATIAEKGDDTNPTINFSKGTVSFKVLIGCLRTQQ